MKDHGVADPAVASRFLTAYAAHDWDAVRALLADSVTWTLPGRAVISGTARGKDAVIERVTRIVDEGVRTTLEDVRIGQAGLALNLRNVASRPDGRELDERLITLLRLDGDTIVAIETYLSDVGMMERYFGLADDAG